MSAPNRRGGKPRRGDGPDERRRAARDRRLPAGEKNAPPYPVILVRSPYGKNVNRGLAGMLCPWVTPSSCRTCAAGSPPRGTTRSSSATTAWAASTATGTTRSGGSPEQPWSNGTVATWGGSALGIVQNMTAPDAPEALKGQVVIVAFSDYYHQAAYQGGVWRKEMMEAWLKATKMEDVNLASFLEHPTYDDFWKPLSAEAHADRVNAPSVFIGGWYDVFLQGTINSFVTIQERGGPKARGKCFLVIAPVAHGDLSEKVNYRDARKAPIDLIAPTNLLAHWLKGERAGVGRLKPVHYYVMGDTDDKDAPGNYWRSADAWPPPAEVTPFYFHADHALGKARPDGDGKLTYKYDAENPVPTMGGQNLFIEKGPMDQRPVESRPDVLLFTTEPLTKPVEVTGRITARLYVSSDCPDTDFTVKLCDVYPDGKSMLVTDGIRRASLQELREA